MIAAVTALVVLLSACSPQPASGNPEGPTVHDDAATGSTVTLRGTAMDAHAGALLVREGERNIFIAGLDYWPKEVRGRAVEVTGTLRSRSLAPEPEVTPEGIVSHGMAGGERLVLEDATWRVVDDGGESPAG